MAAHSPGMTAHGYPARQNEPSMDIANHLGPHLDNRLTTCGPTGEAYQVMSCGASQYPRGLLRGDPVVQVGSRGAPRGHLAALVPAGLTQVWCHTGNTQQR